MSTRDASTGRPRSRSIAGGRALVSADDGGVRAGPEERLERLLARRCAELGDAPAVDGPCGRLSYRELDAAANRLAHFLAEEGVEPGARVALLPEDPREGYVAMLATLKAGAAYVPLDRAFPPERIAHILADAEVVAVLTGAGAAEELPELPDGVRVLALDACRERIDALPDSEPSPPEEEDPLCYVIYTSGTTGRPKGVAISHRSVCNFALVAAERYGFGPGDRVYQGLTLAFDFAVEETWVPWIAGATLVPAPTDAKLVGADLHDFLERERITALCCVPTLLATLDPDLPELALVVLSGETCPRDLVARWHRPGRRLLNVYGPTEATVSATWTKLEPERPVTIGVPLPTYSIVVLDPEEDRALPPGEEGEIGIAGAGLAEGYLNNERKTREAFVEDFLELPENPSGRIYRTGDLGELTEGGEVRHHGRIDTQVKIRGYRVELEEIEAILREAPGVGEAAVSVHEPEAGVTELAGYYTSADGAGADTQAILEHLREQLPAYMVPSYLVGLDRIPRMASGKLDRRALPSPQGHRLAAADAGGPQAEPESELEATLADELAHALELPSVSTTAHLFDELGASSLLLARFIAALRERDDAPSVSIQDVYRHPSVRELAALVRERGQDHGEPGADGAAAAARRNAPEPPPAEGTPRYALCGALQLLALLFYATALGTALDFGGDWLARGHGLGDLYLRALAMGAGTLLLAALLPVAAKWILIGRFRERRIRAWSLPYVRFWIVRSLLVFNPVARMIVGTPLLPAYLRALGAHVGRGALILTNHIPVCADLVSIGSGCVVRKDAFLNAYRARAGAIETGPVSIGDGALVGASSLMEIHTRLGAGAQLGHASALLAGQTVPDGERWHGSPAEPVQDPELDYRRVAAGECSAARRGVFSLVWLIGLLALTAPAEEAAGTVLFTHQGFVSAAGPLMGLWLAAALYFGWLALGLTMAATLPRLARWLEPGRAYPLYGRHYALQRLIARASNLPPLVALFGDSAAIVYYLRLVGYRLGRVVQTGSNFGMQVKHDVPTLTEVGSGTIVSDGLSLLNAEFSAGAFAVAKTAIGERNYLGNAIAFPPGARTGEDCLLATKAMIPLSGPLREGTGLLGSPCFEIPRRAADGEAARPDPEARRRALRAKARHNALTALGHVAVRFALLAALVQVAFLPLAGSGAAQVGETLATVVIDGVATCVLFALAEWAVVGRRGLRPRSCSLYDARFWRHERYWKVPSVVHLRLLDGTPFKPLAWRLLGVRIGRQVLDDGATIVERTLTSVGDGATLGMGATIQGHSLEDGAFKSDHIEVGAGASIGANGFVHYGAVIEAGAEVEADAFLMKGSRVPADSIWAGNPAIEVSGR